MTAKTFLLISFFIMTIHGTINCPEGQYKDNFLDDCLDCPKDASTCSKEGENAEACVLNCIDRSGDSNNIWIFILGVSLAVLAAVVLACIIYYKCKHSNRRTDTTALGNSAAGENPLLPVNRHDEESQEHIDTPEPSMISAEGGSPSPFPKISVENDEESEDTIPEENNSSTAVEFNDESEQSRAVQSNDFVLDSNNAAQSLDIHKDNIQESNEMASLQQHM
ncbi:uncharacterized protein LOC124455926 [Xenia sp. Carnegie-2017]|uniref:uncharacterized protein LOC124455926 n=1 Tax=Xenia sp. Carnegie-2017 TaxID=2897299 RepID=UPI001F0451C5|nr:uncharacterized protein LOC124455926 [Xenia sp. Carnegie-2017]